MVQPTASAGATLQVIWLSGQFQGVIIAQTPIGSLKTLWGLMLSSKSNVLSTLAASMMFLPIQESHVTYYVGGVLCMLFGLYLVQLSYAK